MANIAWLRDLDKNSIAIAGGKGANLAEMYNLGLPVPPAFIVTAQAYKYFLDKSRLADRIFKILNEIDINNTEHLETKSKEIRDLIISSKVPEDLREEIAEAYDIVNVNEDIIKGTDSDLYSILKAGKEPAFVSVRSSATAEDLATASFAGQQDSYLNVKGDDDLIDKIRKCWASLFTARAVYYREKLGFDHEKVLIAVVVQRMINSDKSGVAFTINPATNNKDELIIEAGFGLGEGIVSGAIAPDYYVIDKNNIKIKDIKIKTQHFIFKRDPSGKTVKAELELKKQNQQVMTRDEIISLANYMIQIEEHYNHPQDIEFAIESEKIYILQSRPITTLDKDVKFQKVEKGKVILEGMGASPGIAFGTVRIVKSMIDLKKIQKGDILVTAMTNPDMVITMQKSSAIITDEGGMTAHAAIVSREMGIPCIVGTMNATSRLKEGQIMTVDGYSGKVYEGKVEVTEEKKEEKDLGDIRHGVIGEAEIKLVRPKIYMNLGEPSQIYKYKNLDFDGIGLMRLEFIIASQIREHPLSLIAKGKQNEYVNKLAEGIEAVASSISGKPIIVRFSDFKSNEYRNLNGGDKYEMNEHNPMIGFRGVSRYVSKQFREAFILECRAIKKVRDKFKNVHVMLPFVRKKEEVNKCLDIMRSEGLERSNNFKIYLMAEVPSMALIPEDFASIDIDGVSIGSNDLTQLVLGVDRDSAILGRMGYFDERDDAVLKAISNIIYSFRKEGKEVSICGQAPSVYPEIVRFLVRQGVTSISVNPDVVNFVRKQVIEEFMKKSF